MAGQAADHAARSLQRLLETHGTVRLLAATGCLTARIFEPAYRKQVHRVATH
jgi:hypothetical protein